MTTCTRIIVALVLCQLFLLQANARTPKTEQQPAPLSFIENKGQLIDQHGNPRSDLDYKLSAPGISVFVGDGAIHYQWTKTGKESAEPEGAAPQDMRERLEAELKKPQKTTIYRLDVELVGANKNAVATSAEQQAYVENYYLSQTGPDGATAHSFTKLTYKNIYPHIDWVLYTKDGSLKYDFIVHPGGKPSNIKLKFEGATALSIKDGALTATTPFGSITEEKPYSYNAETKQEVASAFMLQDNVLSFEMARYEGTLVIDPTIYWATYYGGSANDYCLDLTADAAGNAYMIGMTYSSNNIATSGAYQTTFNGSTDAFCVKLNSAGVRQWSTYYGNTGPEYFLSVALDASGSIYCAGHTNSTSGITTSGAHQPTFGGTGDAMLVKFTNAGARIWATYYGGTNGEGLGSVACDAAGNVFMAGSTQSANNISTAGAYQSAISSSLDETFLVKFSSAGVRQWGTYFGGTFHEANWGCACDNNGNIYLYGLALSTAGIATSGAYKTSPAAGSNGYLAKFSNTGTRLWATYCAGTGSSYYKYDIAIDNSNNIYAVTHASIPGLATNGAYQTAPAGSTDGFIQKFSTAGALLWATYFGGPGADILLGMSTTNSGYLYLTGITTSVSGIATAGAYQTSLAGAGDAFLLEMNGNNGYPSSATYFGGPGNETGEFIGCAWSPAGLVYVSGTTNSTSGIATNGAHQTTFGGGTGVGISDGFLAAFSIDTTMYVQQPYLDTLFCPGDTFNVVYWLTYNFKPGNIFTVQLSDASGSFTSPVNIGSKTIFTGDTIKCQIPANTPAGAGYRIRIVSSNPVRTSLDNKTNIRIRSISVDASNNGPVCDGATLNLLGNVTSAIGLVTYSWTGPNSFSSATQNPAISNITTTQAGDYIVTANDQGCIAIDTTTIVVNVIPATPSVNSNTPVCPGSTLTLSASSTTSGVSYSWNGPAAFSSTVQNPSINNMSAAHVGVYSVTATANGCTSPASTTSVLLHIVPTPIASGNNILCTGATLNLTASNIPGATYEWEGPGGFTSNQQNPVILTVQPWQLGPYIVKATVNGCVSEPDTIMILVNTVSTIGGYASPNDTICPGETVSFVAIQTNGGPAPVYQWHKNQTAIPGANGLLYQTQNVSNGDEYYCTMYSVGVCSDPILVSTDTIRMTVVNIQVTPVADISSEPADPLPGQLVTFEAKVVNGGYLPLYQWKRNGQDVIGATHAKWSANNLHPYDKISCVITSTDACASPKVAYSDTIMVGFPTEINDVAGGNVLRLYPNPNDGRFSLLVPHHLVTGRSMAVSIVNALGQVVYNKRFGSAGAIQQTGSNNGDYLLPISMNGLANGVYMLRLTTGEQEHHLRFTLGR